MQVYLSILFYVTITFERNTTSVKWAINDSETIIGVVTNLVKI